MQFGKCELVYRSIVEDRKELVCRFDAEGLITFATDALCQKAAKRRDDLIGSSFFEFFSETGRERCRRVISSLSPVTKPLEKVEQLSWMIDGDVEWQYFMCIPVKETPQGGTCEYQAVGRVMTELKKALEACRETEDRYRRIFENTGTGMMISEDNGMISIVNTEFERLTGYKKSELEKKKTWMDLIFQEDLDIIRETHRLGLIRFEKNPRHTGPERYNFRLVDRSQKVKYLQVTASLIPGTRQNIVSMMDITDMKEIHDAVEQSEKDLRTKSRELQELNTALEVLLKKREKDKKEMERSVSSNIENMILPHLLDLKKRMSRSEDVECVNIIEANLRKIALPFAQRLSANSRKLTLREIQVAGLIRNGKTTKEIAELLGVSKGAIDTHRNLIRKKMGLNKKRINLQSYLASISI